MRATAAKKANQNHKKECKLSLRTHRECVKWIYAVAWITIHELRIAHTQCDKL